MHVVRAATLELAWMFLRSREGRRSGREHGQGQAAGTGALAQERWHREWFCLLLHSCVPCVACHQCFPKRKRLRAGPSSPRSQRKPWASDRAVYSPAPSRAACDCGPEADVGAWVG